MAPASPLSSRQSPRRPGCRSGVAVEARRRIPRDPTHVPRSGACCALRSCGARAMDISSARNCKRISRRCSTNVGTIRISGTIHTGATAAAHCTRNPTAKRFEPESALSPQRQLALLARMADLAGAGTSQFVIATHSPILLTFPDADIISLDETPLRSVRLEETSHYQITRGILENPGSYWRHFVKDGDPD